MVPIKKVAKKIAKKAPAKKEAASKKVAEKKTVENKIVKKAITKKASAKSAPKKAAEKKAPVKKKPVVKKAAVKISEHVRKAHPELCFIVQDGTKIEDIKQMAMIVEALEDHVFNHHVNSDRNDFANWIEDIFEEKELAEELRSIMDKLNTQRIVLKYLVKKHI